MTERAALRDAYDRCAADYGRQRNRSYDAFRDEVMAWFVAEVAAVHRRVVDLGSGPCHEAVLLREAGLQPLAVDFSSRMTGTCRERGIEAVERDMGDLRLPPEAFGGVWASFSPLHLAKSEVPPVIDRVHDALREGGIICVLLFEGEGEGYREADVARYGVARYFAYYRADELRAAVARRFEIVRERRLDIRPRPSLMVAGRRVGPVRAGDVSLEVRA